MFTTGVRTASRWPLSVPLCARKLASEPVWDDRGMGGGGGGGGRRRGPGRRVCGRPPRGAGGGGGGGGLRRASGGPGGGGGTGRCGDHVGVEAKLLVADPDHVRPLEDPLPLDPRFVHERAVG